MRIGRNPPNALRADDVDGCAQNRRCAGTRSRRTRASRILVAGWLAGDARSRRIGRRLSERCSHLMVALSLTGGNAPNPVGLYLEKPVLKLSGIRQAPDDIIGKSLVDRVGQARIDLRTELLQWREAEWRFRGGITSGDGMMHRRSQGINVRTRLDLAAVLFGRRITLRPDHGRIGQRLKMARDAEIDQLSLTIAGHHDIGRL